jgi:hypothetical protein
MTTSEGQALRSEDDGSLACSGLQTELMERTPEKDVSAEPSTPHGIEAVRFSVFAPPGSPLDRESVMIFPLTMNRAGYAPKPSGRQGAKAYCLGCVGLAASARRCFQREFRV